MKVAILDDYQDVALRLADWGSLPDVSVTTFNDHASSQADVIDRLLRSPEERRHWAEKGRRQAEGFTWKRAAEQT